MVLMKYLLITVLLIAGTVPVLHAEVTDKIPSHVEFTGFMLLLFAPVFVVFVCLKSLPARVIILLASLFPTYVLVDELMTMDAITIAVIDELGPYYHPVQVFIALISPIILSILIWREKTRCQQRNNCYSSALLASERLERSGREHPLETHVPCVSDPEPVPPQCSSVYRAAVRVLH